MLFHMCGVCVVRLIMFNYDQLYVVVWVFLVCVLFLLLLFFHFIFFFFFFFLMIRRPPRSTPFPTRRSSDLGRHGPAGQRAQLHCLSCRRVRSAVCLSGRQRRPRRTADEVAGGKRIGARAAGLRRRRSEEHTSELQSHVNLVCRLLLEKKKKL